MTPRPGATAPIDVADQVPSQKFAMAQRLNSKLLVYGDYLLNLTSSAVVQANGALDDTVHLQEGPITSINGSAAGPIWSFMLGLFDDNATALVHNQDSNHPALATLTFRTEAVNAKKIPPPPLEIDPNTGALGPALDDAPLMPGFQVRLQAGDARLFTWKQRHI